MIEPMNETRLPTPARTAISRALREYDPTCRFLNACRQFNKRKPRQISCKECKQTRLRTRLSMPPELACNHCGGCRFPQAVCVFLNKPVGHEFRAE
jgi:hypothetical protein